MFGFVGMCITALLMELWETPFAGRGKAALCFSMCCERRFPWRNRLLCTFPWRKALFPASFPLPPYPPGCYAKGRLICRHCCGISPRRVTYSVAYIRFSASRSSQYSRNAFSAVSATFIRNLSMSFSFVFVLRLLMVCFLLQICPVNLVEVKGFFRLDNCRAAF